VRKREREKAQRRALTEHQRRVATGLIGERYPDVLELVFELQYEDPDGSAINPSYQRPRPRREVRGPQASALFTFPCIENRECIDGGFDLTRTLDRMLRARQPQHTASLSCQGWQDLERIGAHRCLCSLTYTVTATYK